METKSHKNKVIEMKKDNSNFRLYRFRTTESLLDKYKELEDEYFYFASKEELNDPMEGFINLYWQGDRILWVNLLKHYIYCLSLSYDNFFLSGNVDYCSKTNIPIYIDEEKLTRIPFGEFLKEIVYSFVNEQKVLDFLNFITSSNRKVFKNELLFYLKSLHQLAFYYVSKAFYERYNKAWTVKKPKSDSIFSSLINLYPRLLKESKEKEIDILGTIAQGIKHEYDLLNITFRQEYESKLEENDFKAKYFFLFYFSAFYIERLQEISFPNFYYACFMTSCDNVAHWGYYADSNKGCCLIFEPNIKNGKPCINLHRGENRIFMSLQDAELLKVKYDLERPEINFFENIGNLRLTPEQIEKSWYMDNDGNLSTTFNVPKSDEAIKKWKVSYHKKIRRIVTTKFPAWSSEQEYRLFLHDGFECTNDTSSRKFCYDFSIFKGIIFGVNTSEADKCKIIDLLTTKCKKVNRTDFKFYQAEMNIQTGKIELVDLMINV